MTYGMAPNRQNPLAGAAHNAVFNSWRRFSAQVLYVVPPFIVAYYTMQWAIDRSVIDIERPESRGDVMQTNELMRHLQEPLPQLQGRYQGVCRCRGVSERLLAQRDKSEAR